MSFARRIWDSLWSHPRHLVWIALAYVPLLGRYSVPLTGDQKVYLNIAYEMREHGSWLKPLMFGEGSYYKPPLQYWATLVGWEIFGFNLWGALVPSVLAALLTCWLIGELSRLLHQRRVFVGSGVWFAAAVSTVTYATTAQMEIYVCLFYAASWWAGLKYLAAPREERRIAWIYAAFLIAGVSALVKSPLYSVFWVVGYLTYLVISGEWEMFKNRNLYVAWALAIFVSAIWYVAILKIDGERFWADYAMRETWEKKGGNGSGWWELWMALLYFCFPFTLLALGGITAALKSRRSGHVIRFVVSWSWLPAVFFTLYPYRIKPYLYILVPVAAILADWGYFRMGRLAWFRRLSWITAAALFVACGAMAFVLLRAELVSGWIPLAFGAVGVWGLACAWRDWMRGLALCALAAMAFYRLAAVDLGEQDIAGLRAAMAERPAAGFAMLDEGRNIWHEVGMIGAAVGRMPKRLHTDAEIAEFVAAGGLVALSDGQATPERLAAVEAALAGRGKVEARSWKRWKVRAGFPFKDVVLRGRSAIAEFEEKTSREFQVVRLGAKY